MEIVQVQLKWIFIYFRGHDVTYYFNYLLLDLLVINHQHRAHHQVLSEQSTRPPSPLIRNRKVGGALFHKLINLWTSMVAQYTYSSTCLSKFDAAVVNRPILLRLDEISEKTFIQKFTILVQVSS